jgi:hypothetical protein
MLIDARSPSRDAQVDLIPALVTGVIHIFWGEVQESTKAYIETCVLLFQYIPLILLLGAQPSTPLLSLTRKTGS